MGVNDAEKYKNEDESQKERVVAKNDLEAYCFNIKSTIDDEKFKSKIEDSERQTIASKCDETIRWLDSNQQAEKEEFEHKKKELEDIAMPIMAKMYGGAAGEASEGSDMNNNKSSGGPAQAGNGPTIEEVD